MRELDLMLIGDARPPRPPPLPAPRGRVLIVDDSRLPRDDLARVLCEAGFDIVPAELTAAGRNAPQLRLPAPLSFGPNRRSRERSAMLRQLRDRSHRGRRC